MSNMIKYIMINMIKNLVPNAYAMLLKNLFHVDFIVFSKYGLSIFLIP